jgi:hypothetical protein
MPCISRITSEKLRLPFGDGKHYFYAESACGKACEGEICPECTIKSKTNIQGSRAFNHGHIGESIPKLSHIYGGPWYLAHVASYKEPIDTTIQEALRAQEMASKGLFVAPLHSTSKMATNQSSITQEERPKKTKKVSSKRNATPKPTSSVSNSPKNVLEMLKDTVITDIPTHIHNIESMDSPIVIESVRKVRLRVGTIDSRPVWIDDTEGFVFERLANGRIGKQLSYSVDDENSERNEDSESDE